MAETPRTVHSVAVVIPTYNRRAHVAAAIESALAQSHPRVEVIVVDDASTDGTADHVRRTYGERVRLIAKGENGEKCRARNDGIRAAASDYVCMLDSDDVLLPDGVADRVRVFLEDSSFDGVAYGATQYGDDPTPLAGARLPSGDILTAYLDDVGILNNDAFLLSRANMLRHGMYRPELTNMEDRELLIRLTARLPFRFCGTVTQRVRRVDRSARSGYGQVVRQGRALTDALREDAQLVARLGPRFQDVEFMEDREIARALYKLRRYRDFAAAVREMTAKYPERMRGDRKFRRRLRVAQVLKHFVQPL